MLSILALSLVMVVKVVISGPEACPVDEPATIDASKSEGDAFKWLVPEGLQAISTKSNKLIVVPSRPGSYTVTFIAVDKSLNIEGGTHTFKTEAPKE